MKPVPRARGLATEARMSVDTAALGALTVLDVKGAPVTLASLWADRPVVLVWLRHFG